MLDLFYVAVGCLFVLFCWAFTKACDKLYEDFMDYIVAGIASLGLFVYLIYALLCPEKF